MANTSSALSLPQATRSDLSDQIGLIGRYYCPTHLAAIHLSSYAHERRYAHSRLPRTLRYLLASGKTSKQTRFPCAHAKFRPPMRDSALMWRMLNREP